jgi:hypothetical protein
MDGGFLPLRSIFDPIVDGVDFVVDGVASGRGFRRVFRFYSASY